MNLLTFSYWFNPRPEPYGGWLQLGLGLLVLLFIALTLYSKLRSKKKELVYHRFWGNVFDFSLTQSIVGLLLVFFNYEMIAVLMSKFWYLLWLIEIIVWLVLLIKQRTKLSLRKQALLQQQEYKKYLP